MVFTHIDPSTHLKNVSEIVHITAKADESDSRDLRSF